MKVSKCKGTRDLMPQDMARFRCIEGVFRWCCLKWGYEEVRTPTLEYLHLFTSAGTLTPGMLGRVYSFLDWNGWSGERVVLRPDGTIPAARLYIEGLAHCPIARLFYVENIFAFEETRERWQCGAELIGSARPEGDAELILLALEILTQLGIEPVEVRLSHAGLIKGLLGSLDLTPEEQAELMDKILAQDAETMGEIRDRAPELEKPLNLLFAIKGSSQGFLENLKGIFGAFPAIMPAIDDLARTADALSAMGYSYQIDLASARGFEYYTGVIFQFYNSARKMGGGGRYDELIPLIGGGKIPASGFALYLDELMSLIKLEATGGERVLVKAETGSGDELKGCFDVASLLRDRGYIAELDLGQEPRGFRWIISVGKKGEALLFQLRDEISGGKRSEASLDLILRHMEAG
jgi:histidyl-tRNA synthetase